MALYRAGSEPANQEHVRDLKTAAVMLLLRVSMHFYVSLGTRALPASRAVELTRSKPDVCSGQVLRLRGRLL
jgi:hypothetical protein